MSCLGPNYNPQPPREWSRFENNCAYVNNPNPINVQNGRVYAYEVQRKGNILQYKKNSSNLTKQQRYSQIARGMWTNRTTTWATQTQTYTNPNTNSLRRSNFTNFNTTTLAPTTEPITCPTSVVQTNYSLPANNGGTGPAPIIPPPPPPVPPSNPVLPPSIAVPVPTNTIIPDGGTLICTISENLCTGEIYSVTGNQDCYPTSDSDVPGPVIGLCYNDGLPTYYPRNRYTYSAGGNKWPQGEKFLFSANSIVPVNNKIIK